MKKRLFALVIVLTMLISFVPVTVSAATSGTCGDNLTWTLDDDGTLTISGTGDMWDWEYPYAPWYDSRRSVKTVKILDSVTSIGSYAFKSCDSLTSVTIGNGVTSIGKGGLEYCSRLTSITIPNSVTSIGNYAFYSCSSLMSVTIPDSVTSIGNYAFSYCDSLTSITIPNSVTSIGGMAFYRCDSLTSIIIPNSVTSIGSFAFEACKSLTSITIPNSVTRIGYDAFYACDNLTDVYYGGSEADWANISIESGNGCLTNATIHYNSNGGTNNPIITPAPQIKTDINYNGGNELIKQAGIDADNLLSNISLGTDTIKGPKLSVLGHDFYLFQLDGKCSLKLGDVKIQLKIDNEKNSIQFMGGYDFLSESVSTGTSYTDRGEWTKAYNDLKSLHNALANGNLDDKTARSKFGSVYNKLNKKNSNLFLNIKGNFALYGELTWENGSWKMVEGGGIVKASASGSIDPRLGGIFYGTFGVTVDASGKLSLKYDTSEKELAVEYKTTIEPAINVGVGAGSKKAKFYLEGGLKGKLPIDIAAATGSFKTGQSNITPLKVTAKGYVYVSAKALVLGYDNEWQLGSDCVLYPRNGDVTLQSITDEFVIDKSQFEMLPRNYSSGISLMSVSDLFEKNDLYPYSTPKLIQLADGRRLLLWIDDDASKADADRTSMYYSIYTPSDDLWSIPQIAVSNDGYNDLPQVCTDGENVYIVWTCIDEVLGDTAELGDMMSRLDLCYTYFDGRGFAEPQLISAEDNGLCETLYTVSENNGTVTVVWAENSENDLALTDGTNYVYKRTLTDGVWGTTETVAEVTGELHDVQLAKDGSVIYEIRENDVTEIYSEYGKLGESENSNAAFGVLDNEVYYLSGDTLNVYNINTSETETQSIGEITDITILDNGDEKIALSLLSTGFTNELYQNEYKNGEWGEWTQLTEYGKYIRDYSAVVDNGSLAIALNLVGVEDEEKGGYSDATLKVVSDLEYSDIILDDAPYYDGEVKVNGTIDICFNVTNNSRNDIDSVDVTVTDKNGNIMYSGDVKCDIKAGGTELVSAPVTIPENFVKQDLTVEVSADFEENNTDNNTATVTVGFADIELKQAVLNKVGNTVTLDGVIRNIGFASAENITLNIYDSDLTGELLKTLTYISLSSDETQIFNFELPEEYLALTDGKKAIYVEVLTDSEEVELGNNSDRIVFADLSDFEDIENVSMAYTDGVLTIKSPKAMGADFFAAYYDENGALTACRKLELAVGAGTNNISVEGLTTGANVKFMLWDKDMKPLCDGLNWE